MKTIEMNIDALCRYKLTPNQYLLLLLIHSRQYATMYKFGQEGPGFTAEEIGELVDRGFLLNLNKSGYYYVDLFVLTDEVRADLFEPEREKAALEFWNTYPILIRDTATGLGCSLLATDKHRFLTDYYAKVGYSVDKHARVMEALHYAIDHDLVDMPIREWFDSEQWTLLLELKELQTTA
ncbi:hypothetical protein BN8_02323 [Fibrisoma limi BUZ 3]|uniref:Uncharacterized protein n=1 Tax=Fibrisoma limi BUZ 3 TaxID=1185876 RepID=I2GH69_9BACT|nr:hypothetical protein [Fibrisoma limi]CCH53244.1 hypothetical protein BN8_02323 [Fibrisoma limi BUZ 3]